VETTIAKSKTRKSLQKEESDSKTLNGGRYVLLT
jgi:hypothetical protein